MAKTMARAGDAAPQGSEGIGMDHSILPRAAIAQDADRAAQFYALGGPKPENPYLVGTDAHACWQASFERFLLAHSAPEADGPA